MMKIPMLCAFLALFTFCRSAFAEYQWAAETTGASARSTPSQAERQAQRQKIRAERAAAKQYKREHPSPLRAGALSAVVPGLGQMVVNRQPIKGGIMLGTLLGGAACMAMGHQRTFEMYGAIASGTGSSGAGTWKDKDQLVSPLFYVGAGIIVLDWAWAVVDASVSAQRIGREHASGLSLMPGPSGVLAAYQVKF